MNLEELRQFISPDGGVAITAYQLSKLKTLGCRYFNSVFIILTLNEHIKRDSSW